MHRPLGAVDERRPQVHRHVHPARQLRAHPAGVALPRMGDGTAAGGDWSFSSLPPPSYVQCATSRSWSSFFSPQWSIYVPPHSLVVFAYGAGVVLLFGGTRLFRAALFPLVLLWFVNPIPAHLQRVCRSAAAARLGPCRAGICDCAGTAAEPRPAPPDVHAGVRHVHRPGLQRHSRRRHHGIHRVDRRLSSIASAGTRTPPSLPGRCCWATSSISPGSASWCCTTSWLCTSPGCAARRRWATTSSGPVSFSSARFCCSYVVRRSQRVAGPDQAAGDKLLAITLTGAEQ